ncbi:Fatty acid desaturase domain [Trinorchestia longiramus]|nr:Fatty acid desaturase domain [Trinorchestia longiramus]
MPPHETLVSQEKGSRIPTSGGKKNPTPGFRVDVPTDRDVTVKTGDVWINGKKIDDNIGNLWRIHDKLYDFSSFIDKHPGGQFWLETTKGTDITEAFEAHHLNPSVEKLLPKFFVKDATTKRNSPYTFHENGFYKTLKRRAWTVIAKVGSGPTLQMKLLMDGLVALFLSLLVTSAFYHSYLVAMLDGLILWMVIAASHNFFHKRDNFRMYYWDLSALSSGEWRITHGLSHHLFTNTVYDFEISSLEPFLHFLPESHKGFFHKYVSPITCHLYVMFAFPLELVKRTVAIFIGSTKFRWPNLLPFFECLLMIAFAGSVKSGFALFLTMMVSASSSFMMVGIIAAHHHPDIYHAHDTFRSAPDWGLCQLDAVRDRVEVTGSLFLVAISFGDHTLHHLFPTVDHSKLPLLYPVFLETCKEFNINFTFMTQKELMFGMYTQLASSKSNTKPPGYTGKEGIVPKVIKDMIENDKKKRNTKD